MHYEKLHLLFNEIVLLEGKLNDTGENIAGITKEQKRQIEFFRFALKEMENLSKKAGDVNYALQSNLFDIENIDFSKIKADIQSYIDNLNKNALESNAALHKELQRKNDVSFALKRQMEEEKKAVEQYMKTLSDHQKNINYMNYIHAFLAGFFISYFIFKFLPQIMAG